MVFIINTKLELIALYRISIKSAPRAKAAPKRRPLKPVEVIHEKINMGSDDEEIKEPPKKRRVVEKGASQKKENTPKQR